MDCRCGAGSAATASSGRPNGESVGSRGHGEASRASGVRVARSLCPKAGSGGTESGSYALHGGCPREHEFRGVGLSRHRPRSNAYHAVVGVPRLKERAASGDENRPQLGVLGIRDEDRRHRSFNRSPAPPSLKELV